MGDKRKQQSIRAARDWLDEADASLAKGSGLQGDLKVMLARAELQRAEETEPPTRFHAWRRWARRIVPLTAAAAVVALAWFLTPAVAPPETAGIPSRPVELVTPATQDDRAEDTPTAEGTSEHMDEMQTRPAQETPMASSVLDDANGTEAMATAPVEAPSPAVTGTDAAPATASVTPTAPAIPAPETQKLMQSAGKALRQP